LIGSQAKCWVYRCSQHKKGCDSRLGIPKKFNFNSQKPTEESEGEEIVKIKKLGGNHTCKIKEEKDDKLFEVNSQNVISLKDKEDYSQIQNYIRANPLKGVMAIQEWCKNIILKATKYKIKHAIYEIRQEIFTTDKEITLSKPFCLTKGTLGCELNFCRFRGTIIDSKDKLNEVIIFTSPCLLRLLNNTKWYLDGTFKIAPHGYRQLLIINVYHSLLSCCLPACFILMTHKNYISYNFAFSNLKNLCEEISVKAEPSHIMCDFENGLRKGIRKCFPNTIIAGCYFHYCKALWYYMASNSLTTKERLLTSIKLMTFLKILAHIKINERKSLFEEISSLFKTQDKKYANMLRYYENNWLKTYYVETMNIGEKDGHNLITRTNNFCEAYNNILNMKIGVTSPRLSILVTKLIEEEFTVREFVMKAIVNSEAEAPIPQGFTVQEDALPISKISKLLEERKKKKYDLRSVLRDKEFIQECKKMVEKCYETLFLSPEDHLDVENNQEEGDTNPGSSIQEGDDFDEQFSLKLFSVLEEEKEEMKTLLIDVPKEVIPSSAIKRFKKYNYLLIYILENFRTSEVKLSLILL